MLRLISCLFLLACGAVACTPTTTAIDAGSTADTESDATSGDASHDMGDGTSMAGMDM
jgi:hypothetical protein